MNFKIGMCHIKNAIIWSFLQKLLKILPFEAAVGTGHNGAKVKNYYFIPSNHKTQVELLSGQFEHQVLFNPPPSERESQGVKEMVEESHKRKAVEEVTVVKKQKLSSNGNPDVPWFDSSAGIVLVGEKDGVEWRQVGNRKMLVRTEVRNEGKDKIAAFDIDGTLDCK